jgi:hypothetical protein
MHLYKKPCNGFNVKGVVFAEGYVMLDGWHLGILEVKLRRIFIGAVF